MDRLDSDYGHLEIRLAELIEKKGLNRNRLSLKAGTVLECNIHDLLVFVPTENKAYKK